MLRSLAAILPILICSVLSYPDGAPESICQDFIPQHGDSKPIREKMPFVLTLSHEQVGPSEMMTVRISVKDGVVAHYEGFYLVAQKKSDKSIVGTFADPTIDADWKRGPCKTSRTSEVAGVTHNSHSHRYVNQLKWIAPADETGEVCIRGAIVEEFDEWYVLDGSDPDHCFKLIDGTGKERPRNTATRGYLSNTVLTAGLCLFIASITTV